MSGFVKTAFQVDLGKITENKGLFFPQKRQKHLAFIIMAQFIEQWGGDRTICAHLGRYISFINCLLKKISSSIYIFLEKTREVSKNLLGRGAVCKKHKKRSQEKRKGNKGGDVHKGDFARGNRR